MASWASKSLALAASTSWLAAAACSSLALISLKAARAKLLAIAYDNFFSPATTLFIVLRLGMAEDFENKYSKSA